MLSNYTESGLEIATDTVANATNISRQSGDQIPLWFRFTLKE